MDSVGEMIPDPVDRRRAGRYIGKISETRLNLLDAKPMVTTLEFYANW